jgi:hypothetical protein
VGYQAAPRALSHTYIGTWGLDARALQVADSVADSDPYNGLADRGVSNKAGHTFGYSHSYGVGDGHADGIRHRFVHRDAHSLIYGHHDTHAPAQRHRDCYTRCNTGIMP